MFWTIIYYSFLVLGVSFLVYIAHVTDKQLKDYCNRLKSLEDNAEKNKHRTRLLAEQLGKYYRPGVGGVEELADLSDLKKRN